MAESRQRQGDRNGEGDGASRWPRCEAEQAEDVRGCLAYFHA